MRTPFLVPFMSRPTYRRQLLAAALDGLFMGVLTLTPFVATKHFHTERWLIVGYMQLTAVSMLAAPMWARVAARTSRRRLFIGAALGGRAVFLLLAFSPGSLALLGIATLGWLVQPVVLPAVNVVWQANYPPAIRGRIIGRVSVVSWTGVAAGAYGGSQVLEWAPWAYRLVFPLAGLLGMAALWLYADLRLRRRAIPRREPDRRGWLAPWRDAGTLLRRNPLFARYELGFMTYGFGFFFVLPLLADHCARDLGLGYEVWGIALALQQIVQGAVNPLWGSWWDRLGTARTARRAFGVLGPFAVALALVEGPWQLYGAMVLFGFAMSGVHVTWNLGSVEYAGREDASRYMAVHAACVGVRSALAPPLAFAIQAWFGSDARYAFLSAGVFFMVAVAVMGWLHRASLRAEHAPPTGLVPEPPALPAGPRPAPTPSTAGD